MSKVKSKGGKDTKADVLTKTKDAGVSKPAQTLKSKSKDLSQSVATKAGKTSKEGKKQVAAEPSSSEESESDVGSESEGESEVEKPANVAGKSNGSKAAEVESSDESDDDSEDGSAESGSDSEGASKTKAPNGVTKGKPAAAIATKSSQGADDGSANESDSDEDDEAKVKNDNGVDNESDEEDSDNDSDESDDSEASNEPVAKTAEVKTNATKRKVEEEATPVAKKSKTEAVDTSKGPNLFVGNLSWNVDEEWLRQEFEEFGELSGVRLITDRDSGRSKGFGYVEYIDAASAAKAYAGKKGTELDGRPLNVDFANTRPSGNDRQDNRRKSYGDQIGEPTETLFLGNLPFDVGQETVSEAFSPYGTILSVRLPTDRETGELKGFGYVTFGSTDDAKAALEAMSGSYINGRQVRLDYSQPRPQNGDSSARGFGGRGRGGFGGRGRGDFGGRGRGGRGGRGDRGGGRGGRMPTTNRGGFGDFSGHKTTF